MPISALSEDGPPFDPDAPPVPLAPWGRLMFDNQQAVGLEWSNQIVRHPQATRPRAARAGRCLGGRGRPGPAESARPDHLDAAAALDAGRLHGRRGRSPIPCPARLDGHPPGRRAAPPQDGRLARVGRGDRPGPAGRRAGRSLYGPGRSGWSGGTGSSSSIPSARTARTSMGPSPQAGRLKKKPDDYGTGAWGRGPPSPPRRNPGLRLPPRPHPDPGETI